MAVRILTVAAIAHRTYRMPSATFGRQLPWLWHARSLRAQDGVSVAVRVTRGLPSESGVPGTSRSSPTLACLSLDQRDPAR